MIFAHHPFPLFPFPVIFCIDQIFYIFSYSALLETINCSLLLLVIILSIFLSSNVFLMFLNLQRSYILLTSVTIKRCIKEKNQPHPEGFILDLHYMVFTNFERNDIFITWWSCLGILCLFSYSDHAFLLLLHTCLHLSLTPYLYSSLVISVVNRTLVPTSVFRFSWLIEERP